MGPLFQDRADAGRTLAGKLRQYANEPSVLVLALPRGGVPVGYEVARALNAPLDVFLVRKLGVPGYEELAMGAIASNGVCVMNEDVVRRLGISRRQIEETIREETQELERRQEAYRGQQPPIQVQGKKVILVDDGLATGATMRAAVQALRQQGPAAIIVAAPVGAPETCQRLAEEVERVICGQMPEPFYAIGTWYSNFLQTTDEEVRELLERAARERAGRPLPSQTALAE